MSSRFRKVSQKIIFNVFFLEEEGKILKAPEEGRKSLKSKESPSYSTASKQQAAQK